MTIPASAKPDSIRARARVESGTSDIASTPRNSSRCCCPFRALILNIMGLLFRDGQSFDVSRRERKFADARKIAGGPVEVLKGVECYGLSPEEVQKLQAKGIVVEDPPLKLPT